MSHPLHPMLSEVATLAIVAIQAAATSFLLAVVPPDQAELVAWTMLPMIGATLAAVGAFCFNPHKELIRIVVGRGLFAIAVGVLATRCMAMIHPRMADLLSDPLLKVGAGLVHGIIGYIMSWPLVKKAYERAPLIAAQQVQALETRLVEQVAARVAVAKELSHTRPPVSSAKVAQAIAHAAQEVSEASPQPPTAKP